MKLSFAGLEHILEVVPGRVSILQIESVVLFSRVCQSVLENDPARRLESFTLWGNDGKEVSSRNVFLPVFNPFDLPWRDRALMAALYEKVGILIRDDDALRRKIEAAHWEFEHLIADLSLTMNGSYSFGLEWDVSQSLKAYSFGVDRSDSDMLLDNVIRFIEFVHDVGCEKALLFVNLDNFLTRNELIELEAQLFFHNIAALMLVQGSDALALRNAKKLYVDQEFLEYAS